MVLAIVEISRIVRRQAARALVLNRGAPGSGPGRTGIPADRGPPEKHHDGLRILNDPCGQPADCQALRQERLRQVLYRDFDFAEFSKRVLAQKWPLFSEAQRREFVEVFSRFLSEHYLSRLQQHYTNEKVLLHGQTIIAPGRAVVKSGVVWMNREFAVEVRMHAPGGDWKIYDVTVIGFSAVQIYRTQFQHLMRTQSPAQVIALIKSQLANSAQIHSPSCFLNASIASRSIRRMNTSLSPASTGDRPHTPDGIHPTPEGPVAPLFHGLKLLNHVDQVIVAARRVFQPSEAAHQFKAHMVGQQQVDIDHLHLLVIGEIVELRRLTQIEGPHDHFVKRRGAVLPGWARLKRVLSERSAIRV